MVLEGDLDLLIQNIYLYSDSILINVVPGLLNSWRRWIRTMKRWIGKMLDNCMEVVDLKVEAIDCRNVRKLE